MKRRIQKGDTCLNCGLALHNENFCPDCGQLNNIAKPTIGQLILDALANLFAFDSKFYISIWPLMRYPGKLSLAVVSGKKATYLPPIRMFLLVVLVTLGLNSINNRIDRGFNNVADLESTKPKNDRLIDFAQPDSITLEDVLVRDLPALSDSLQVITLKEILEFVKENPATTVDSALTALNLPPTNRNKAYFDYAAKNVAELERYIALPQNDANTNTLDVQFTDGGAQTLFGRMFKFASKNPRVPIKNALSTLNVEPTTLNQFYYSYALKLALMSFTEFLNYIKGNLIIILLLFVPIMALVLKTQYFYKRDYYYVDHFIFSIHTQTAFFVIIALAMLLKLFFGNGAFMLILFVFPVYLFFALKNFYQQRSFTTFLNFIIVNISYFFVSGIFLFLVGLISFLLI